MTSRERTGILPRPYAIADRLCGNRTARDWTTLIAFGALNAAFLLTGLYGGSSKAKLTLLKRLGLPPDALPHLGAWKADVGLLRLVADHILEKKPRTVVEFGTGASTLIIGRALGLCGSEETVFVSLDQHEDFTDKTREWLAEHGIEADLRVAPLIPAPGGWPGLWYDDQALPRTIDFMLVDGPPWSIHPFTRGAAATLFDRIPVGGVVMLDDGARAGERVVAARWRALRPDFRFELVWSGSKGTLVGTRLR